MLIARELIVRKLAGQEQVARNKLVDSKTADSIAQFRYAVASAKTIEAICLLESRPVKVTIDNLTHLAHTIDITDVGARLGALRMQLHRGTIISLQRGSKKAKFRVEWIRELAPNELQAGIESLEPQDNFWGVDLSDREHKAKKDMQALLTLLSNCSKSVT